MNLNVFIVHSNKFIELAKWFSEFLRNRGLNPIIMELTPNAGRLWSVPEKENYLLSLCETALIIATPDEIHDDIPVPRLDVSFEIGRLKETKKAIILKEETVKLPKSLEPVYIGFSLEEPSKCLDDLDKELVSIFGENVNTKQPFNKQPPKLREKPVFTLDGKGLAPENPMKIQQEMRSIFMHKSKKEQVRIIKGIRRLLDEEDEDKRWVAGMLIEEIIDYDSQLVPMTIIVKMSEDNFFSVRSSAAVCLYKLSNISPGSVPLDLVIKLASPKEDWYVLTPAIATLKTLAHRNFRALEFLVEMSSSKDKVIAEYLVPSLFDVIKNDPWIVDIESLKKLTNHESKLVREYAEKMIAIIKNRPPLSNIIRYSPF